MVLRDVIEKLTEIGRWCRMETNVLNEILKVIIPNANYIKHSRRVWNISNISIV